MSQSGQCWRKIFQLRNEENYADQMLWGRYGNVGLIVRFTKKKQTKTNALLKFVDKLIDLFRNIKQIHF